MADYLNIAGRIKTTAADGVALEAQEVKDLEQNKFQTEINADVQTELANRYTKQETYSKEQLDNLITSPDVNYVSVVATDQTTDVTDILPASGEADTIYRVGNWNGSQYDTTVYSLYAWNGSAYVCLAVRSFVGEVYDISANHPDGQGNPTTYADLAAALGTGGANVPADIRRGGMSVKFVLTYDNTYVQYRLMATTWSITVSDWAICNDTILIENPEFVEVTTDKDNKVLWGVKSDGNFYFGAGCPPQVKAYLESKIAELQLTSVPDILTFLGNIEETTLVDLLALKVDKVEGKSLIDSDVADNIKFIENPEFAEVKTDLNDKILEGIKTDGTKVIELPMEIQGVRQETIDNPEFIQVDTDLEGRIIGATKPNGKKVLSLPTNQDDILKNEIDKLYKEFSEPSFKDFIDIKKGNFGYHQECIFHDDFNREIQDSSKPWLIGSNSETIGLNIYDYLSLYPDTIDDGFRITSDNDVYSLTNDVYSLTNVTPDYKGFRLVKALQKTSHIVIEINNETLNNIYQAICFNVEDSKNYELLRFHRTSPTALVVEYVKATNGHEIPKNISVSSAYDGNAIRLYFVKNLLRIYLDDTIVYDGSIDNDINNIGLFVEPTRIYSYKFFNIYYVSSNLMVIDTSGAVDKGTSVGVVDQRGQSETIDPNKTYCYRIVSDVVDFGKCEKFDVKYQDGLTVVDDREENVFNPVLIPMLSKWHLSFDLMYPADFVADSHYDGLFQLHESAANVQPPCIFLTAEPSNDYDSGAAFFIAIEGLKAPVADNAKIVDSHIKKEIYPVKPGEWHHFDLWVKQGYMIEHNPLTIIEVDGVEVFRSIAPNSFNVARNDYPKYGLYKPMWSGSRPTSTNERIVYFDNVKITY